MAVGATSSRVFGMVILDGLKVSIPGITIGALIMLLGAAAVAQAPAKPRDPLVYAAAALVLIAVTVLSCYYAARRAARISPNQCLRCE
jgi:ABC-type antimicrobial peptide transport system permease subunit